MMGVPLRVLMVEDSENDALLLLNELRRGGFEPAFKRVETDEAMSVALYNEAWDLIIADYVMPHFSGLAALKLMKRKGIDLPFIIVSGRIGEDVAVEAMKAGAHDYVMKTNLTRLVPAVERELHEATERLARRLAEKDLEEGERFLANVFESIQDGISVLDTRYNIVRINASVERWFPHSIPLLGKKCYKAYFGRSTPCERCPVRRTLETGLADFESVPMNGPDGERLGWLELYSFPLIDAETGNTTGVIEYIRDITVRKRAEEELHRVNRALQTLSHGNQAVVHAKKESELLQEMCRVIVEVGGYRLAWVGLVEPDEEKTVRPVAQSGYEEGYFETADATWADTERGNGLTDTAVRTGEPSIVHNILTDSKYEPWRAEAVRFGYASAISLPLLENGQAFGVLNLYAAEPWAFTKEEVKLLEELAEDLAFGTRALRTRVERERSEEALRVSHEELKKRTYDLGERVKELNCLYGVSKLTEKRDLPLSELFQGTVELIPPAMQCPEVAVAQLIVEGETYQTARFVESAWRLSSDISAQDKLVGSLEVYYLRGEPEEDVGPFTQEEIDMISLIAGQLGKAIERSQASEELGRAYEDLQDAYKVMDRARSTAIAQEKLAAIGRLTAGVTHEILNPLNAVNMMLYMLLDDKSLAVNVTNDLKEMESQVKRIIKISQDLLYFSRQRLPERRPTNLNEIVEKTLSLIEHELKLGSIELKLELLEDLPQVLADQDQLQQVFLNLLTNAQDALSGGGRITVKTTEAQPLFEGSRVLELRLEDTGPGINTEHMGKLFDPFFTTKPEGKGTGLGLSICHGIVEAHGGSIWAENAPAGGATFVIRLPAEPAEESNPQ